MTPYEIGVKLALHAADRLKERTGLHPGAIPKLQAIARRLSPVVPEGHYYLPLQLDGVNKGYAAFKTVGEERKRLVLSTILGRDMQPRGKSLAGLVRIPDIKSVKSAASL